MYGINDWYSGTANIAYGSYPTNDQNAQNNDYKSLVKTQSLSIDWMYPTGEYAMQIVWTQL